MNPVGDIWAELGLTKTKDVTTIRRAYAARLKAIDPEADPAAFIALREARDRALWAAQDPDEDEHLPENESPAVSQVVQAEASPGAPNVAEQAPALEADFSAVDRLRAMIFDPADRHGYEDIAAQTEAVMRDPAMLNIEHARQMEGLIANIILQGTPRSDAMIDPAVRYFKWDRVETELTRPAIVDWILRRRGDSYFENSLHLQSKLYTRVLDRLRQPVPESGGWFLAWRLGVRVEFLLAYLQQFHPTVINGLAQPVLDWWRERIVAQHKTLPPFRWLREIWRRLVFHRGIATDHRDMNFPLYYGIFFLPYVFVWFLLRRGHSWKERAIGFAWCGLIVMAIMAPKGANDIDDGLRLADQTQQAQETEPVEWSHYKDFNQDVQSALSSVTDPVVSVDQLRSKDPKLYHELVERWTLAKRNDASFVNFTNDLLRSLYPRLPAALHGDDAKMISDFATFYATELRWVLMGGPQNCIDFMRGKPVPPFPFEVLDYRKRLLARALLSGPPHLPRDGGESLMIPPPVFDAALKRSRLSKPVFQAAVQGKGRPDVRCTAQIVLLEAAASHPSVETTRFLRGAFAKL